MSPRYDVSAAAQSRILHIGCSAFHRAHQALITHRALELELNDEHAPWGITATSLMTSQVCNSLNQQDGLYTVIERGPEGTRFEIVGSIRNTVSARDRIDDLYKVLCDPATKIVTLTVTAAGYGVHPVSGRLDIERKDVKSDLQMRSPRTVIGVLTRGLQLRHRLGYAAPVLLSCDNVPANGRTLRQALLDFASLVDPSLVTWIDGTVQTPTTMVDRVVPRTTARDRAEVATRLGIVDRVPVVAEPYLQWIIEDFDGPRPRWDECGATYVSDAREWEQMKLKLLNGTHLVMAILGQLSNIATVSEFISDQVFRHLNKELMHGELRPTLRSQALNSSRYAYELIQRWDNARLPHELNQVGRNCTQKIYPRLLSPLLENIESRRPSPVLTFTTAAWIKSASDPRVNAVIGDPRDPLVQSLCDRGAAASSHAELVDSLLSERSIFGTKLPDLGEFRRSLVQHVDLIASYGVHEAARALTNRVIPCAVA